MRDLQTAERLISNLSFVAQVRSTYLVIEIEIGMQRISSSGYGGIVRDQNGIIQRGEVCQCHIIA